MKCFNICFSCTLNLGEFICCQLSLCQDTGPTSLWPTLIPSGIEGFILWFSVPSSLWAVPRQQKVRLCSSEVNNHAVTASSGAAKPCSLHLQGRYMLPPYHFSACLPLAEVLKSSFKAEVLPASIGGFDKSVPLFILIVLIRVNWTAIRNSVSGEKAYMEGWKWSAASPLTQIQ